MTIAQMPPSAYKLFLSVLSSFALIFSELISHPLLLLPSLSELRCNVRTVATHGKEMATDMFAPHSLPIRAT
jgi:hypothetical protein